MNPTEMKRFLRETWELWYWAMFCPSKLQQRMNEWAPQKDREVQRCDTTFENILIDRLNLNFCLQYLIVLSLFLIPVYVYIATADKVSALILIPSVILISYGIACQSILTSWIIPSVFASIFRLIPDRDFFEPVLKTSISWHQITESLILGSFSFSLVALVILLLQRNASIKTIRNFFILGGTLSGFMCGVLATQSWLIGLWVAVFIALAFASQDNVIQLIQYVNHSNLNKMPKLLEEIIFFFKLDLASKFILMKIIFLFINLILLFGTIYTAIILIFFLFFIGSGAALVIAIGKPFILVAIYIFFTTSLPAVSLMNFAGYFQFKYEKITRSTIENTKEFYRQNLIAIFLYFLGSVSILLIGGG